MSLLRSRSRAAQALPMHRITRRSALACTPVGAPGGRLACTPVGASGERLACTPAGASGGRLACTPVGASCARASLASLLFLFTCHSSRQVYTETTPGGAPHAPHPGPGAPPKAPQNRGPPGASHTPGTDPPGRPPNNKNPPERRGGGRTPPRPQKKPPGRRPHGNVFAPFPPGEGSGSAPHLGGGRSGTGADLHEGDAHEGNLHEEGAQAIPCCAGISRASVIEPPTP